MLNNIDPMQLGRIMATVTDVGGPTPSTWAMPCVPLAGKQMGTFMVPQIGSGVWLQFEAGDPDRPVRTVAVCGGSGDAFLAAAAGARVDAYVTADLRHHPVSEYLADGGPALVDAAHWATEQPWLAEVALGLTADLGVRTVVSELDTDPWTLHTPSRSRAGGRDEPKETRP